VPPDPCEPLLLDAHDAVSIVVVFKMQLYIPFILIIIKHALFIIIKRPKASKGKGGKGWEAFTRPAAPAGLLCGLLTKRSAFGEP